MLEHRLTPEQIRIYDAYAGVTSHLGVRI